MPRPECPVHKCYYKEKVAGKGNTGAFCRGCGKLCSNVVSRMEKHADECMELKVLGLWKNGQQSLRRMLEMSNSEVLNKAVAAFVYECNVPFAAVSSAPFQRLIHSVAPNLRVPGRRLIAGRLLSEEYDRMWESLKVKYTGRMVSMSVDCWTTKDNIPLVGVAIGEDLVELQAGEERHTGELLAEKILRVIAHVQRQLGCQVISVVTDGASNMSSMRSIIEGRPGNTAVTYWCQAHCLNLAVLDFFKHAGRADVLNKVSAVLNRFRNVHCLGTALRDRGMPRPPIPCQTRWTSTEACFVYYNKHWAVLTQIAALNLSPVSAPWG